MQHSLTHTHTVTLAHPLWARERSPRRADGMLSELIPRVLAEKRMSLKFIGRNYKSNNNSNNWENNSSSSSSAAAAAAALTLSDRLPDIPSVKCIFHSIWESRDFMFVPRLAVKSIDRRGRLSWLKLNIPSEGLWGCVGGARMGEGLLVRALKSLAANLTPRDF